MPTKQTIVARAMVPAVTAQDRMASAAKAIVAKAATATAEAVVVAAVVASVKARANNANVSMPKAARWPLKWWQARKRPASPGRTVDPAMPHKASARSVVSARSVRNVVAVAVAAQTVQTCRRAKFGLTFAVTHDRKAAAINPQKTAKHANPGAKAVAGVAIGESPEAKVVRSATTALPAPLTAHRVQHPPKWPKAWPMVR